MKKQGIAAIKFEKTDKTDFLILPFALFYSTSYLRLLSVPL